MSNNIIELKMHYYPPTSVYGSFLEFYELKFLWCISRQSNWIPPSIAALNRARRIKAIVQAWQIYRNLLAINFRHAEKQVSVYSVLFLSSHIIKLAKHYLD